MPSIAATPVHPSPVGDVVDVATFNRRLARRRGIIHLLAASFFLAVGCFLLFVGSQLVAAQPGAPEMWLVVAVGGFILLFALCYFGLVFQLFRFAKAARFYFRAGRGGLSLHIPVYFQLHRMRYKTIELNLPWSKVKTWYPAAINYHGAGTHRTVVLETMTGRTLTIYTACFVEGCDRIAGNIASAARRERVGPASDPALAYFAISGPDADAISPVKVKLVTGGKPRDPTIATLDLSQTYDEHRQRRLAVIADLISAYLQTRYPPPDGYRQTNTLFTPFKEWPAVRAHGLYVHRGLFWGFTVKLAPADFLRRTIVVQLTRSTRLDDGIKKTAGRAAIVAIAAGFVLAIADPQGWFRGLPVKARFLLIPLALGFAVGALVRGLLWLVTRPMVMASNDARQLNEEANMLRQALEILLEERFKSP